MIWSVLVIFDFVIFSAPISTLIFLLFFVIFRAKWEYTEYSEEKYNTGACKDNSSCLVVGDILHCWCEAIVSWGSVWDIFGQVEEWDWAHGSTAVSFLEAGEVVIASCFKELINHGHGLFQLWVLLILWEVLLLFENWLEVLLIALSVVLNIWGSKVEWSDFCIVWSFIHYI